ncbi:unnamed protein product [Spirodela intermedia]|uniref:Uncharacterized protein n=1 Tax=Spirodela intermedia TaxID=51605 RepID=A0A7I8LLB0_SPIIN|nr:unnamed protein product [Spirodela intermedia]
MAEEGRLIESSGLLREKEGGGGWGEWRRCWGPTGSTSPVSAAAGASTWRRRRTPPSPP